MLLRTGTSGFSYKEWRGTFYEEGLPESKMLAAYSARLPTVEINNTFYRMPKASMLGGWAETTGPDFTFALKAPRRITHVARLRGVQDQLRELFTAAEALGPKLGPVLFQLPPFLRKDVALISDFAAMLPKSVSPVLEFRHESWFCDEVYAALSTAGIALCASEVDEGEGTSAPFVKTAPFIYVRLRRETYSEPELDRALEAIRALGVERAYVYFKHEVLGPAYALALQARAPAR
jgi:uncharacterized protein YecE (DUF72 family)